MAAHTAKQARDHAYYLANRERILAMNRDWAKRNQERVRALSAARVLRMREANVDSDARLDVAEANGVTKLCTKCQDEKSVAGFYRNKNTPDGLMGWCKDCARAAAKARYYSPEGRAKDRAQKLKKFGLTLDEWDALVTQQGGRCASCSDVLGDGDRRPHVDHDHVTGRVRGILCHGCNTAEGLLKGDPERAIRLAEYMQRHLDALAEGGV